MQRQKWIIGGTVALAALLAACGPAYEAYREYKEQQREKLIESAWKAVRAGDDAMPAIVGALEGDGDLDADRGPEQDDPTVRRLAMEIDIGSRTPQQASELLRIAREEAARWNNPGGEEPQGQSPSVLGTRDWFNLGPASSRLAYNGTYYRSVDSGRATAIRLDLAQPNTIYLAVSGGGLWRADDFGTYPTWVPKTDTLGALSVSALDLDPNAPGTLWIGLGDAFDQKVGAVVKSTDRGDTWGTPLQLSAATHPADGFASSSLEVRDLRVDPTNSSRILVATDDGFYVSTDGGGTFSIVDLPNTAGAPRREATWNIAYLGTNGTDTSWAVSGVWACPPPAGASGPTVPPTAGIGTNICATDNTQANWGDVWTTSDSGATWTSTRAAGTFPAGVVGAGTPELGRIQIAAGAPTFGATTLYAQCENVREAASFNAAILKSTDSGATWTAVAQNTGPNAPINPPALLNPTTLIGDCNSLDISHGQGWYNLSVIVDPTNPNHALFGGNLCGVRTMDGGATWENVAHWLPQGGGGFVGAAGGFLPYVHADWHTGYATLWNGQLTVFAGTDGGLFLSQNVFSASTGTLVSWIFPDVGLSNHLMYSVGTGDPVFGNESVVFGGLQDNGTRWRLIQDEAFIAEFNLQNWDQIIGGDGVGTAVSRTSLGHGKTYWSSVPGARFACRPDKHDCSKATRIENGVEVSNWRRTTAPAALRGGSTTTTADDDGEPFLMRYSTVNDANSSVISASVFQVWKIWQDGSDQVFYQRISPTPTGTNPGGLIAVGAPRQVRGQGPYASPVTYNINGTPSRVYGLPLTGGASGVIVDTGATFTFFPAATALNVSGSTISFTQSVAIPADPAHLGGTDIRQTWLLAVSALTTNQGGPVTPAMGHLFKTIDGGATWVPFHGDGTGFDLPNVPVYIVRFDPSDPSDQTIWAGTEFGVYRTTDGGNTWARYGLGLPAVRVDDLQISSNGALVRVATYGRGIWEIRPHGEAATAASLGDWDNNGVIDYFDLAGLTVRMGSTPTMTHNQFDPQYDYDNAFDLVPGGSPATLDEADLSALLAKFGGTP